MNEAKKYQLKEGWEAGKVAEAACQELSRLQNLGLNPSFAVIEFDAEEGNTNYDKKHLYVGSYHDLDGFLCHYIRDANGEFKHRSPSIHALLMEFIGKGGTVVTEPVFWNSHNHIVFFSVMGWEYLDFILDGLEGIDPNLDKA